MNMRRISWLVVLAGSLAAAFAAAPSTAVFSANRAYSLELSNPATGELLAAVFHNGREGPTLVWSRKVEWDERFGGSVPDLSSLFRAIVTSDGTTVVLRDRTLFDSREGVTILRRGEDKHVSLFPYELLDSSEAAATPRNPDGGVRYIGSTILDFVPPEEDVYAMWLGGKDRWFTISLTNCSGSVVTEPLELDRLNNFGREHALTLVQEHQPSSLAKALRIARERISSMLPGVVPPPAPRPRLTMDTTGAYLFLATRKNPADKKYIDGLLEASGRGVQMGAPDSSYQWVLRLTAEGTPEQILADFLLQRWNGAPDSVFADGTKFYFEAAQPLRRLGELRADIDLPFRLPAKPGFLWAYLIPADLAPGKGLEDARTLPFRFTCEYPMMGAPARSPHPLSVSLQIKAVPPGEYRVACIWERHPKITAKPTGRYLPQPGDYHSVESTPFRIVEGIVTTLAGLECTNRVGSDALRYAADDAWGSRVENRRE